jgi:Tfp pilus assembly protein PilN
MIKVNLLEGAADTRAATRATKAAAKTTQQVLLIAGALVALLLALGVDYYVSKAQLDAATSELKRQQALAEELKQNRAQKEQLEKQIKAVEERIKIIDDLQKNQKGPSSMLDVINSKMPGEGIRLDRINQRKDSVTVEGVADDPNIVSDFGRGLELGSNGLFSNIGLNVNRTDEMVVDPEDETAKKLVTSYKFTISMKYSPTEVGAQGEKPAETASN